MKNMKRCWLGSGDLSTPTASAGRRFDLTIPPNDGSVLSTLEEEETKAPPIRVGVEERIPVAISLEERRLLIEQSLADPELVDRLRLSEIRDGELRVGYTLSELEELQGYIAAEANHTSDATFKSKLLALWKKLRAYEDLYEDELSPGVN